MKKKLISMGIALAMVLSLSLVMAVPALAAEYTIQGAVNAADPGDTVVVPAGEFDEDVTISADITLEGAQAGVCAVGGRTGGETELTGSIKVTSAASYVVIDGFTITGTAGGAMDGVCMRTESANVTVVNNIFSAVAVAGGYTYSGIVDLDGLTDALVECNSFSGVYDQARAPNVIRLGITGVGPVTVANNEMTEVGGGGGVGIMCTNADAVVNILGNDFDHTGDGVWACQSIALLRIEGNTFHHNNACHGGACQNIDTGVKLVGTINGVVVIEGNDFLDNTIQVDNSAGVVDLEEVLANNTFDRAVVVDRPGSSLLYAIWSKIQDAVNASQTGDTIRVMDGLYNEAILVDQEVAIEGESLDATVDGSLELKANNITVDGLTIKNGTNKRGIFTRAATGPTWGSKGHTIINNELIGPGDTTNYGINVVACDTEPVNILIDNNKMSGWRIAIMLEGYGTTITNNDLSDNTKAGIDVERSCDSLISLNDICDNGQYGIFFGSDATTGNVVVYNNIHGNDEYGILNNSNSTVTAINNYWCSASGPTYNPGCGDRVSDDVLYNPWLLDPVVPGEEPVTYDRTLVLQDGWTLVSTDGWIDTAESVWVGKILAYTHTVSEGYTEAELAGLVPVDGMYVKTDGCGGIGIVYSDSYPAASNKDLEAGWNLISSATLGRNGGNARAVLSPLRWVQVGEEEGVCLTTLVSQGAYNLHSDNFYLATLATGDWVGLMHRTLNPFDGYWVYLNVGKSFGVIPQ